MAKRRVTIPTFDQILEFSTARNPRISPDGDRIVYILGETDWALDRFTSRLWIVRSDGGDRRQLTFGDGTDTEPCWSPNGKTLAFLRSRKADAPSAHRAGPPGKKKVAERQIWLIQPDGGEARRLTDSESNISSFSWHPDGRKISYQCTAPEPKARKKRRKTEGDYQIFDEDARRAQLWVADVRSGKALPLFDDEKRTVVQHRWSPDGKKIVLILGPDDQLKNSDRYSLHVLDLAGKRTKKLVDQPGPQTDPVWSPDGKQIAFSSAMGRKAFYHANDRIVVVPSRGGAPVSLTDAFDESANILQWDERGIAFSALQGMAAHLFRLDPHTRSIERITGPDDFIGVTYDLTPDGSTAVCACQDAKTLPEIAVFTTTKFAPRRLTDQTRQTRRFTFGTREPIRWRSKDGTEIEGILYKPIDFDPRKKHPLLVVIHGGPASVSRPVLDPRVYVYPVEHWLARGAVILNPNYRGSTGYGEAFRQRNVRNLGVGDMWDVLSGVDHLVRKGFVDTKRMGAMGWSQGGYISAFLATNTNRFQALSVGAGISNWVTYYVQTDVTPFTIQYLGADPWDDPDIYAKTSPMTNIKNARTPTLIQHGEFDLRVPTPNAYELRQGLEDQGVPVRMILYTGQGHGLGTPKLHRGALEHNREWFDKWVFGDTGPKPRKDGKRKRGPGRPPK